MVGNFRHNDDEKSQSEGKGKRFSWALVVIQQTCRTYETDERNAENIEEETNDRDSGGNWSALSPQSLGT
jgi:hypothetical protein